MPRTLVPLLAAALALSGCGEDAGAPTKPAKPPEGNGGRQAPAKREPRLKPVRCPAGAANCSSAVGRIIYVEAVDPDGDGDAHFVLASPQQLSGPGITVIDVERELRPHPLPHPGDLVAAAGPVYRGSYGQRQIEADEIRVRRR